MKKNNFFPKYFFILFFALTIIFSQSEAFALENSIDTKDVTIMSFVVEKPITIVEKMKFTLKGWEIYDRQVEYDTFTFRNGIKLDEERCRDYIVPEKEDGDGILRRTRIQEFYYITY